MAAVSAARKTITLVTGGNGGIGYELVSQLLSGSPNNHVLLGSRSVEKGQQAVKQLQSQHASSDSTVELLALDVTDEKSIESAAKEVQEKHGRLDALVNNAAVALPGGSLAEQMEICFKTNATGPLLVVEAFAPLLRKSQTTPRILNVSSGAGSIKNRLNASSPMYKRKTPQYNCSKAALNMVTACQVAEFGDEGFKVFSFCPGFTVSNLSVNNIEKNGAKPTSEGAAPMIKILQGERDDEHAGFLHNSGQFPW